MSRFLEIHALIFVMIINGRLQQLCNYREEKWYLGMNS